MTMYASVVVGFLSITLGVGAIVATIALLVMNEAPQPDPIGFIAGCGIAFVTFVVALTAILPRLVVGP